MHKCVHPACMFINRILNLFRKNSHKKCIQLDEDFKKDLLWFIKFFPSHNKITFFQKESLKENKSLCIDGSLIGMGGFWGNKVYSTPIFGIPKHYCKIANLEMLKILIALRVWADQWAHRKVLFRCDNLAVVQVIRTSKTRDEFLACCLRNIWLVVSVYDIKLKLQDIRCKNNRATDALSRFYSDKSSFCI